MTISGKVFNALTTAIKLNDNITRLTEDLKELNKEVKEIDRRLIRIETFIEIAEKQRQFAQID